MAPGLSHQYAICAIRLSDRQAADAVRGRIDWKYALGLELADPGFDASVLSEFRTRLVEGHAEEQLFTVMLTLFKERGWRHPPAAHNAPIPRMCAALDSCHQSTGLCGRNAAPCASTVWRSWHLNGCSITASQSGWIATRVRLEDSRLPSGEEDRQTWAQSVGHDGAILLQTLFEPGAPAWVAEVPAVEILRRVWVQNYQWSEGKLGWRSTENIPPAALYMSSPYDLDAHTSREASHQLGGVQGPSERHL